MAKQPWSTRKRLRSVRFAWAGLGYLLRTQHNAWIHAVVTVLVLVMGIVNDLSPTEWCLVTIVIGFVWSAEAFNTSLEALADALHPDHDERVGHAKDVAAAAVLVAALTAVVVGAFVFF